MRASHITFRLYFETICLYDQCEKQFWSYMVCYKNGKLDPNNGPDPDVLQLPWVTFTDGWNHPLLSHLTSDLIFSFVDWLEFNVAGIGSRVELPGPIGARLDISNLWNIKWYIFNGHSLGRTRLMCPRLPSLVCWDIPVTKIIGYIAPCFYIVCKH